MVVDKTRRPRVLILASKYSSSGDCVHTEGGDILEASPYNLNDAIDAIDNENWDGLVLTGGGDIDPRCYNQVPDRKVYGVSENRDLVEHYALEAARDKDVPVLGICRGMQMIAVEAGGQLIQNIHGHQGHPHKVQTLDDSIVGKWAGSDPNVVSLHHQAVQDLPDDFRVTAMAKDGTVEAIESSDRRVLGVQFHPEIDHLEHYSQRIFRWLVEESARSANIKLPKRRKIKNSRQFYSHSRYLGMHRPERTNFTYGNGRQVHSLDGALSNFKSIWVCPVCYMRFEGAEAHANRDFHVELIHDGMVTSGWLDI